jgi:hypothetical protein
MISGDADADGQIGNPDIENYWKNQAGKQGYLSPDVNLDSQVDNRDKDDFWLPNKGIGSQVPN